MDANSILIGWVIVVSIWVFCIFENWFKVFYAQYKEGRHSMSFLHNHRWFLAGVKKAERMAPTTVDSTNLLYRCKKCPEVRTKTITGIWTRSDLGLTDE